MGRRALVASVWLAALMAAVAASPVIVWDLAPIFAEVRTVDNAWKSFVISQAPEYLAGHSTTTQGISVNGAFLATITADHGHGVESILWSFAADGSASALRRDLGACDKTTTAAVFAGRAVFVCRSAINATQVILASDGSAAGTVVLFNPSTVLPATYGSTILGIAACSDALFVFASTTDAGAHVAYTTWAVRPDGSVVSGPSTAAAAPVSARGFSCPSSTSSDGVALIVSDGAGDQVVSYVLSADGSSISQPTIGVTSTVGALTGLVRVARNIVMVSDGGRSAKSWSTSAGGAATVEWGSSDGASILTSMASLSPTDVVLIVAHANNPTQLFRVSFAVPASPTITTIATLTSAHARGVDASPSTVPAVGVAGTVTWVMSSSSSKELWSTRGLVNDAAQVSLPVLSAVATLAAVSGIVLADVTRGDNAHRLVIGSLGLTASILGDLGVSSSVAGSGPVRFFPNDAFFTATPSATPTTTAAPTATPSSGVATPTPTMDMDGKVMIWRRNFGILCVCATVVPVLLMLGAWWTARRYERWRASGGEFKWKLGKNQVVEDATSPSSPTTPKSPKKTGKGYTTVQEDDV